MIGAKNRWTWPWQAKSEPATADGGEAPRSLEPPQGGHVLISLAMLLGVLAGYWNVFQPDVSFFIMVLPLAIVLFQRPKAAVYTIWLTFMGIDALTSYGLPRRFTWIMEFALVLLFVRALFERSRQKEKIGHPLAIPIFLLVLFIIGGAIFRETMPVRVLLGFRFHYKFILLGLAVMWMGTTRKDMETFFKWVFVFALLQIPFTLWQAASWGRGGDWCVGTFPPNTTNTFALWLVIVILSIYNFFVFGVIPRRLANLGILLFVPLLLAWSRFSVLLMPVLIIFMFFINPTQRLGRRMRAFFAVMLGFFLFFWGSQFIVPESHEDFINRLDEMYYLHARDPVMDATGTKTKPGKLRQFRYVMGILSYEIPMGQVFGFGLGEASESFFGGIYTGDAWRKYQPMAQYDGSQISWTLMQIGWVGFALTLNIYIWAFLIAFRFLRRTRDPFWQATALCFCTFVLDLTLSLLYTNVWDSEPLSFMFWFVFAGIARENYMLKKQAREAERLRLWNEGERQRQRLQALRPNLTPLPGLQ